METIRTIIEKAIRKKTETAWAYEVDLRDTILDASSGYHLVSFRMSGEGGCDDLVKTRVRYVVPGNRNTSSRVKIHRGYEAAIRYLWTFAERFRMCPDCCRLNKTEECEHCVVFRAFAREKQTAHVCGICQEETHRVILECRHAFHKACLMKMDPDHLKCPMCRQPVSEDVIFSVFDDADSDGEDTFSDED